MYIFLLTWFISINLIWKIFGRQDNSTIRKNPRIITFRILQRDNVGAARKKRKKKRKIILTFFNCSIYKNNSS